MAYSASRLEKARRLFPGQGPVTINTGESYNLRSRTKTTTSAISSWIDNDKDDDYTPRRGPRSKRRLQADRDTRSRTRRTKRARSRSPTPTSSPGGDQDGELPSSSAPNTPADTDNTGQSEWETWWQPQSERDPNHAYFLRPRKGANQSDNHVDIDRGKAAATILEGSSPSQGPHACEACQMMHLECSLTENPLHYPCDFCQEDDCDCILDPPPVWKRQCEHCKKSRRRCSYLSGDYDHSRPCWECQQHGFKCVAGPAKCPPASSRRRRAETEDTEMADAGPKVEPAKRSDRLLRSDAARDSKSKQSGDEIPLPTKTTSHSAANDPPLTSGPSIPNCDALFGSVPSAPAIPTFGPNAANPYGTIYRIRTYYAHPLTIWGANRRESCDWCHNFAYGIVGLGPRNPEVLDFNTGRLIEIKDGHLGEGKEASHMCWECASERLQIMRCSHHEIGPLMGRDRSPCPFDEDEAYRDLAHARAALQEPSSPFYGRPFPHAKNQWCSLCQEPASWCCESDQTLPAGAPGGTQSVHPVDIGCGLLLCEYCAHHVERFGGDLDRAVAWGKQDPENKTVYRADVDYILRTSQGNFVRQQISRN